MKMKLLALLLALALCFTCAQAETLVETDMTGFFEEIETSYAAFDGVLGVQPGSAGSSLKCAIAACGLLDWSMETPILSSGDDAALLQARVADRLIYWWAAKDEDARQLFLESIDSTLCQADELVSDRAACEDLLASAGDPAQHDAYDPTRWQNTRLGIESFLEWVLLNN